MWLKYIYKGILRLNKFNRMSLEVLNSNLSGKVIYLDNVDSESINLVYDAFFAYVSFKYGIKNFSNLDYFLDSVERELSKLSEKYEEYIHIPLTNFESDRLKLGNVSMDVSKAPNYYSVDITGSLQEFKKLLDFLLIGHLTDTVTVIENGTEVKEFTSESYVIFLESLNELRRYLRKLFVENSTFNFTETDTYKWISEFDNLLVD